MSLTAAIKVFLNGLLNWSELTERWWRDCTQRSYLMLLIFGGLDHAKFRLGIYTGAEGERFEDAEGLPETSTSTSAEAAQERGLYSYRLADVASRALFGVVAHDATEAELPGLLNTIGVAIALPGQGTGLPAPASYPSGYTGSHSVTVVPVGNGQVVVMNPLDVMQFEGSLANVSDVLAWHSRLPNDIRYVRRDEFANVIDTPSTPGGNFMDVIVISPVSQVNCAAGGSLRDATTGAVISAKWSAQTGIFTWGKEAADTIIRVQAHTGGPLVAARYPTALCTPVVATPPPTVAVNHTVVVSVDGVPKSTITV